METNLGLKLAGRGETALEDCRLPGITLGEQGQAAGKVHRIRHRTGSGINNLLTFEDLQSGGQEICTQSHMLKATCKIGQACSW